MLAEGSLDGRVALVTGGGSGLGRAMALELDRLGAKVAVLGRRRHVLEETVAQLADGVAVRELPRAGGGALAERLAGGCQDRPRRDVSLFARARAPRDRARRRQRADRVHRRELLARFGTVAEIANACAYLVSDYAAYVTGDVLTIDGGAWLEQGMFR
jgi:NAD(P)-dependent dehydrogenase (short-subunit alcohol dehydrogenase family)